jgi:cold-inducible RNA-binding protein
VGAKLYVGSLPYSTTDQDVERLFGQHGRVNAAKVMTDRYTGRSRGFGFVEMASAEEAQRAIAALNGTQYEGRTLVINEAKPEVRRERAWGGGDRRGTH